MFKRDIGKIYTGRGIFLIHVINALIVTFTKNNLNGRTIWIDQ